MNIFYQHVAPPEFRFGKDTSIMFNKVLNVEVIDTTKDDSSNWLAT